MIDRRTKLEKLPAIKSLDSFDFKAIPSLNKMIVLELKRCEWIETFSTERPTGALLDRLTQQLNIPGSKPIDFVLHKSFPSNLHSFGFV